MDRAGPFDGDWSGRRGDASDQLCDEARLIIGQINALQAELAVVVAKVAVAVSGDLGWGFKSVEHRISHELHISSGEAKKYLALGQGLEARPTLAEACADGEFGLQAAEVMVRSSDPHTEAKLVEHARNLSTNQLQRTCAAKRRLTEPKPPQVEDHLSITLKPEGGYRINGHLGSATGSALLEQLAGTRSELATEEHYPSALEALLHLVDSGGGNISERYLALFNVDLEQFEARLDERRNDDAPPPGPTGVTTPAGQQISDAEIDRIFNSGLKVRWAIRRQGHPVWVSQRSRLAPDWMRTLLRADQPECVIDGCTNSAGLHAHHMIHYEELPETRFGGLALLCGHHHRLLHRHDDLRIRPHPTERGVFVLVGLDGEPIQLQHRIRNPDGVDPPDVAGPAPPCGDQLDDYALDIILERLLRPPPQEGH